MTPTLAYAAQGPDTPLAPHPWDRREPGPTDVRIEILFCGVCHSDLHTARGEWGGTIYPVVPGHEIVGRVSAVGASVTRFREGQLVGVGCLVDSCQRCTSCGEGLEQYCENGFTGTYGSIEKQTGRPTAGGYSSGSWSTRSSSQRIPRAWIRPRRRRCCAPASPPTRRCGHWNAGSRQEGGDRGSGGLGHMGVKIAARHGCGGGAVHHLAEQARGRPAPGRHHVVVSRDKAGDGPARQQLRPDRQHVAARTTSRLFLNLLKPGGTMVLVGAPAEPHPSPAVFSLIMKRRSLAGSLIGGIAETQEMLDFCGQHGIVSDIEMIRIDEINEAYERMLKGDVRYRFVIDMESLKALV
jgi:uncharacterized zinc-type alcohol dehydrogenase-like protein